MQLGFTRRRACQPKYILRLTDLTTRKLVFISKKEQHLPTSPENFYASINQVSTLRKYLGLLKGFGCAINLTLHHKLLILVTVNEGDA